MLIFEGTDMAGKTTLANAVIEYLNFEYKHPLVYQHLSKLSEHWKPEHYLELLSKRVVMDRFFMSRQAYGTVFQNQEVYDPNIIAMLDSHTRAMGGFTVLVLPTNDVITKRWEKINRAEMYDLDGVLKINSYFSEIEKHPAFDLCIGVNDATPSDIETLGVVKMIGNLYMKRQRAIKQIGKYEKVR